MCNSLIKANCVFDTEAILYLMQFSNMIQYMKDKNIIDNQQYLEGLCDVSYDFNNIKKIIQYENITPTVKCLQNASKHSNIKLIQYLIENHNLKPDVECLTNIIKLSRDKTAKYIVSNMN